MSGGQAITEAFWSWRDYLARIVSRIVPPHEIEDIVQETYVRACQLQKKEAIKSPGAFMATVARNLALDHVKRAEVRLTSRLDDDIDAELGELHRVVDATFHQAVSEEEFAHFCEAVRRLPVQCRKVFILKKVYGHSQREIARVLNLSENTVEKHIARGIKECARYMRDRREADKKKATVHNLHPPAAEGGNRR